MISSSVTLFDGVNFSEIRRSCPSCTGPLRRHDVRKKRFARLIWGESTRNINVYITRYRCGECHRLWYADEPFYPDTRHGVPVVDLAVALSTKYPFHKTARILSGLGILIDRGTVRLYNRLPIPETTDMYGIPVPNRIIALSGLVAEGGAIEGAELLAALSLPFTERAAPERCPASEEERDE
ncbi:hypothetical protein RJ53_10625 [Methanocalculus chunghsingensis]|uniref:Uncharacterized protein n=1 Tax=Methanocalculus chunghsingensis TaxID=156457 RepID=A0A8J7W8X0_9EURY|nr:hypothetical protein [Methanocalculus chunghsingensis]MBR1369906.1 hypothetical protein [Methanocalculus chunghsingensis]